MAIKQVCTTAAIISETPDAVTVELNTGGIPFVFMPGQFVYVTLMIEDMPVTRPYSLSSLPGGGINPAITVKRVSGGVMSNFIIDNVSTISKWYIEGPYGNFIPSPAAYNAKLIVLLAGGSGIVPLYSIGR